MDLIPTQEEVLAILRETGALRTGHFEDSNGLHSGQHLEPALAMRYYRHAKVLSVGLSRLLRADPVIRPIIPDLSMVATTVGGLPVAYGLCEALHARQVYWAEKESQKGPLHFRQYLEQTPGEKVLLVDDILRSGRLLNEAKRLIESKGAQAVGVAVLFHIPTPKTEAIEDLPLYYLAQLETPYYSNPDSCRLCRLGVPLERIAAPTRDRARAAALIAVDV
jgi:orotate phosphoribosyltransferase